MTRYLDRITQLYVWVYVWNYGELRATKDTTVLAHTEQTISGMEYYEASPSDLIPAPLSDNYIH